MSSKSNSWNNREKIYTRHSYDPPRIVRTLSKTFFRLFDNLISIYTNPFSKNELIVL